MILASLFLVKFLSCQRFCDLGLIQIRHSSYTSLVAPWQTNDIWVLFCLHSSKLMTRCDSNVGGRTRCYFAGWYLSPTAVSWHGSDCNSSTYSFQSLIYLTKLSHLSSRYLGGRTRSYFTGWYLSPTAASWHVLDFNILSVPMCCLNPFPILGTSTTIKFHIVHIARFFRNM